MRWRDRWAATHQCQGPHKTPEPRPRHGRGTLRRGGYPPLCISPNPLPKTVPRPLTASIRTGTLLVKRSAANLVKIHWVAFGPGRVLSGLGACLAGHLPERLPTRCARLAGARLVMGVGATCLGRFIYRYAGNHGAGRHNKHTKARLRADAAGRAPAHSRNHLLHTRAAASRGVARDVARGSLVSWLRPGSVMPVARMWKVGGCDVTLPLVAVP